MKFEKETKEQSLRQIMKRIKKLMKLAKSEGDMEHAAELKLHFDYFYNLYVEEILEWNEL